MNIPFYRPAPLPFWAYFQLFITIKNGWLTSGKQNALLQKLFSQFFKNDQFLLLNSATSGLKLALHIKDIGPGDEVILPVNTFISTFEAVIQCGASPILADIDSNTWTISIDDIKKKLNSKTKSIIPVNFAGNAPDMKGINHIAKEYGLSIIYDNAHGIGDQAESWADITVFSFYATKNITTGEGGGILFKNEKDFKRAEPLILHGMDKKSWNRYHESDKWKYDIQEAGFKYNLPDINAVLAISQIKNYQKNLKKRTALFTYYHDLLKKFNWVQFQSSNPDFLHVHHLLPVKLENTNLRKELSRILDKNEIGYSYHFIPICDFTFVRKKYFFDCNNYPNMMEYYQRAISLPFFPSMKRSCIDKVYKLVKKIGSVP